VSTAAERKAKDRAAGLEQKLAAERADASVLRGQVKRLTEIADTVSALRAELEASEDALDAALQEIKQLKADNAKLAAEVVKANERRCGPRGGTPRSSVRCSVPAGAAQQRGEDVIR
jgi:uncharacterized protein involved in exopolysaccharide biosynthesis